MAYYSEFSGHCAKYYVRYRDPRFKTNIEKKNWTAARDALIKFSEQDRETLREIYLSEDTFTNTICRMSKRDNVPEERIWILLQKYNHEIAKKRGMI